MTTTLLRQTARELADEIRSKKDRYFRNEVLEELAGRLKEMVADNSQLLDEVIARAAKEALIDIERQDAPKHDSIQGYLFQPDRFVALGATENVRMAVATFNDGLRRSAVIDENLQRQAEAHFQEKEYWNARFQIWANDPSALLLELERDHFDWGA